MGNLHTAALIPKIVANGICHERMRRSYPVAKSSGTKLVATNWFLTLTAIIASSLASCTPLCLARNTAMTASTPCATAMKSTACCKNCSWSAASRQMLCSSVCYFCTCLLPLHWNENKSKVRRLTQCMLSVWLRTHVT